MSIPRFEIHDTSNQEFRFKLIAANNGVLLTSETYTAVSSAKDGICAVRMATQVDVRHTQDDSRGSCIFGGHTFTDVQTRPFAPTRKRRRGEQIVELACQSGPLLAFQEVVYRQRADPRFEEAGT